MLFLITGFVYIVAFSLYVIRLGNIIVIRRFAHSLLRCTPALCSSWHISQLNSSLISSNHEVSPAKTQHYIETPVITLHDCITFQ